MVAYPRAGSQIAQRKIERERIFIFQYNDYVMSVKLILCQSHIMMLHTYNCKTKISPNSSSICMKEFKRVKNPMVRELELKQQQWNEKDLDIFYGIKWKTQVKCTSTYMHLRRNCQISRWQSSNGRKMSWTGHFARLGPRINIYIIISKIIPSKGN